MAVTLPAGFVYWDGFGYLRESDKAGPYRFDGVSTMTLFASTGTPIAATSAPFKFRDGCGWFNELTGAGPHVFDGTNMTPMA